MVAAVVPDDAVVAPPVEPVAVPPVVPPIVEPVVVAPVVVPPVVVPPVVDDVVAPAAPPMNELDELLDAPKSAYSTSAGAC